jgi:hypothetical protein
LAKFLPKNSAVYCEANVAGEGEVHAGARGRAVDCGDDGLRHGTNIQDGMHPGAEDGCEFGGIAALAALADGAQIAAGTEGAACAGEDDDVNGRVAGDSDEGLVERGG